jgi:hypothetical protein
VARVIIVGEHKTAANVPGQDVAAAKRRVGMEARMP